VPRSESRGARERHHEGHRQDRPSRRSTRLSCRCHPHREPAFRSRQLRSRPPPTQGHSALALRAGLERFSYTVRAKTPGTFVAAPAKAEEMYSRETFGRSTGQIHVISDLMGSADDVVTDGSMHPE
jgi:hypothetical protein